MKRRGALIVLGAGVIAPFHLLAQNEVRRIGFLAPRHCPTPANPEVHYDAFVRAMHELGYVQGKNLIIEWRCADGKYERLPGLAAELVAMKPELIVTHSTPALEALRRSTSAVPVVAAVVGDPVASGFASSLARPGGNVTGLTVSVAGSGVKHVELLKIAVPQLSRFALLVNPDVSTHDLVVKAVQSTAQKLRLTVLRVDARTPDEIDLGFGRMSKERVGAVLVNNDAFFIAQRRQIVELALRYRLPSAFDYREDVIAGGLMSYGQDNLYQYRRAAAFVDKILKGAKPADLPFEQPTKIHFAINLKTAKAIGIPIPHELLLRADEVIE